MTRSGAALLTAGRVVAFAALGWAVAVAVTGGFVASYAGIRLSSHRVVPAYAVAVLILLASRRNRDALVSLAERLRAPGLHAAAVGAAAAAAFGIGVAFGAFTAAGDAFGYLSQSAQWLAGNLFLSPGPTLAFSWPSATWLFAPLGYAPALDGSAIAPTYPAGLPLMMAAMRRVFGSGAEFLVVPVTGSLAVLLTYRLGRLWYGREVGLTASVLTLVSPVFLFQLVQPMSDVPATAAWLLSVVALCEGGLAGALGAGLAASLAILIRPNLAPLVLPLGIYALLVPARARATMRLKQAACFAAGLLPLGAIAAWVNSALYGSPLSSGYGRAADLYALSNFLPNLARYPRWLVDTHTAFVTLALAAPLVRRERRASPFAFVFAAGVCLCYAFYLPFEHWSFLRFLLPAIPVLLVLSAASLTGLARRAGRLQGPAVVFTAGLVALVSVQTAVRGDVFSLRTSRREQFEDVGRTLGARTKENAVFFSLVHTVTARHYAQRDTVRFDLVPPTSLDTFVGDLRRCGYVPYVLVRRDEVGPFRARFSAYSAIGRLDWPPTSLDADGTVLLFDLAKAPVSPRTPMRQ